MSDWIKIKSKYPNKCKDCNAEIEIGESILWKKGEGVKHEKCEPQELEEFQSESKIVTPEEWKDFTKYSHEKLQTIINCQCCGKSLDKTKDVFINADKRTCQGCFLK